MPKFVYDGLEYSSNGHVVKLTQAEYDALPNTKLADDIIYLIIDSNDDKFEARNLPYDGSITGLGNTVQDAIDECDSKLKYDEKTGLIYFKYKGEWKEWIQPREMATEYILYENSSKSALNAGSIQLTDALGNYTYYKIEFYNDLKNGEEAGNILMSETVSTDTLIKLTIDIRYRNMTAIDNIAKTVSFTTGYQGSAIYNYIVVPKRIIAYGKKTIY